MMYFYDNDIVVFNNIISCYGAIKRSIFTGDKVRLADEFEVKIYKELNK